MPSHFTNEQTYAFLAEECRRIPQLWDRFGQGIIARTTDPGFWHDLSDHLDCFRVCDECGNPMIEGYVVDGHETYCSDNCLHKHISEEEFDVLYDDGYGDTYWTTWYEDSLTYKPLIDH